MKIINKKYLRNISGQSLFEVVLAIAVIGLIVVGVVILSTNAIRNTTFARNKTLASRYAQEALEWVRNERNTDPVNFRSKIDAFTTFCLDEDPITWTNVGVCSGSEYISGSNSIFKRQVVFSQTSQNNTKGESVVIINVAVTVTWVDSQGTHNVKSTTDLSDLREL